MSQSHRFRESLGLSRESLLRNDHPRTVPANPDAAELEPDDVHLEPAAVHVHARHEEMVALLEEEERGIPILVEQVAVVATEALDLRLGEDKLIERTTEVREDLQVGTALDHFVDFDRGRGLPLTLLVESPVLEIEIDVAGKDVPRLSDRLHAVRLADFDGRDEAEEAVLGRSVEDDPTFSCEPAIEVAHPAHAVDAALHVADADFRKLGWHSGLLGLKALGFPLPEVVGCGKVPLKELSILYTQILHFVKYRDS